MAAVFVSHRASPFPAFAVGFAAIPGKGLVRFCADRDTIFIQIEGVLVNKIPQVAFIEVDERLDARLNAVTVNSIGIMGSIQEEFSNPELRKPGLHGKEGMEKREHIMPGSPLQERENRQVILGVGGDKDVKVVAVEVTFAGRIPTDVAVRLGKIAFAGAVLIGAVTDFFPAHAGGSPDRGAVTGQGNRAGIDEAFMAGDIQELLFVKPEDKL